MENNNQENNELKSSNEKSNSEISFKQKCASFFKERTSKEYMRQGIKSKWGQYITFFAIIAVVLTLDLVLKSVFDGKVAKFIGGFISIDGRAHNTGAAFSMFSNATVALLVFSIIFVVLFFLYEFFTMNTKRSFFYYIAFALLLGGTLGNLVDRLNLGYVRDFIKLEFVDFPIFNIADCALTVGVILLAIWMLFIESRRPKLINGKE